MQMSCVQITGDDVLSHQAGLIALLQDAVDDGASVGFIAPLSHEDARRYWDKTQNAVASGDTLLSLALDANNRVAGSVQLGFASFPNGHHRLEVKKLLVHRDYRNQGIAKSLMARIEEKARALNCWLLVLDTVEESVASRLYTRLGYVQAGVIPQFALSSAGIYEGTVVFYKVLR